MVDYIEIWAKDGWDPMFQHARDRIADLGGALGDLVL
jgi:hypothetical protein